MPKFEIKDSSLKKKRRLLKFGKNDEENEEEETISKFKPFESFGGQPITDNSSLKGTSTEIEKSYLRLTDAPSASNVRTEPTLKEAVSRLETKFKQCLNLGKHRDEEQVFYFTDQMKAIRQDLVVQGIRNHFSIKTYQTHARMALQFGDKGEFGQCIAAILDLYQEMGMFERRVENSNSNANLNLGKNELAVKKAAITPQKTQTLTKKEGESQKRTISLSHLKGSSLNFGIKEFGSGGNQSQSPSFGKKTVNKDPLPCVDEFLCYRILHFLTSDNRSEYLLLRNKLLGSEYVSLPSVKFAFQVWSCINTNDLSGFFRLHKNPPHQSVILLDWIIADVRRKFVKMIHSSFMEVSIPYLTKQMAFPNDHACLAFLTENTFRVSALQNNYSLVTQQQIKAEESKKMNSITPPVKTTAKYTAKKENPKLGAALSKPNAISTTFTLPPPTFNKGKIIHVGGPKPKKASPLDKPLGGKRFKKS